MGYERLIAGVFVGAGALILIWKGEIATGASLLSVMVGFFIGEKNGARTSSQNSS